MACRRWRRTVSLHALFVLLASCDPSVSDVASPGLDEIKVKDYGIQLLAPEAQFYSTGRIASPILPGDSTDADGILMAYLEGTKHYHPVQIAQRVLVFLNTFRLTGDSVFVHESRKFIDKLLEIGVYERDALYFPYGFSIYPHGGTGTNNTQVLTAPWFSGMAQGQVLSALVGLYGVTRDAKYLHAADLVFRSFLELKSEGDPWTVYVDPDRYYWVEEYPLERPSNVLNGSSTTSIS